jgi:carbon-monoxide dehydrogenase medium subunit
MFPNAFEYVRPESLEEALRALHEYGDDAKVLAGGQSLLPMMKLRVAAPGVLVDINRVPGLSGREDTGDGLVIGALTRHATLEHDRDLRARYPLLAATAAWIADPLVRNRGTIAGSLAHADPAADWGAALLALHGSVTATGPEGARRLTADDLFVDIFTTSLAPTELITAVHVPPPRGRTGGTYLKLERKVGDFAIVGVAITVSLDEHDRVREAGIGMAAVGARPLRAAAAEEALRGQVLTPSLIREAAALARDASDPTSDTRGSAAYERDVVRLFVERGLHRLQADLMPSGQSA